VAREVVMTELKAVMRMERVLGTALAR
jgi:hypothetical protein